MASQCNCGVDLTKKTSEKNDGWTVELENSYRFQCAGYRNAAEYMQSHGSSIKFNKDGLIQKLRNSEGIEDCYFPNTRCLAALSSEQAAKALKGENLVFAGTKYEKLSERQKVLLPLSKRNEALEFVVFHGPNEMYTVVPLSYDLNPVIVAAQLFYESQPQAVQVKKTKSNSKRKNAEVKAVVWSQVYTCTPRNDSGSEQSLVSDKSTVTHYTFRFKGSGKNEQLECTISCASGPTKTVSVEFDELNCPTDMQSSSMINLSRAASTLTVAQQSRIDTVPDATTATKNTMGAIKKARTPNVQAVSNISAARNYRMACFEKLSKSLGSNENIENNIGRYVNSHEQGSKETERVNRSLGNAAIFERQHSRDEDVPYYSTSSYSRCRHTYTSKGFEHSDASMRKGNNGSSLKLTRPLANEPLLERQSFSSGLDGRREMCSPWPNENNSNKMDCQEDNDEVQGMVQLQNTPRQMMPRMPYASPSLYETQTQQHVPASHSVLPLREMNNNWSSSSNTSQIMLQSQCSDVLYRDARMTTQFPFVLQEEHRSVAQERHMQRVIHRSTPLHGERVQAIYPQSPDVLQLRSAAEFAQQWLQHERPQASSPSFFASVQYPNLSIQDFSPIQQLVAPSLASPGYTGMHLQAQPDCAAMHVDFPSQLSQIQGDTKYVLDQNYSEQKNPVFLNSASGFYYNESLAEERVDVYSPNVDRDWNSNPAVFGGLTSSPENLSLNNRETSDVTLPFYHLNESRISCDHLCEDLEGIRPLNWNDQHAQKEQ